MARTLGFAALPPMGAMIGRVTAPTSALWRPRRARAFLVVVLAVAATLLGAGSASAATPSTAQTRVGASTPALTHVVGVAQHIAAGQRWVNAPPHAGSVVATGVAANTGSRFGSLTHSSSGIASYSVQRTVTAGQGGSIQAHHLIEQRFARVMSQSVGDMPSVVVTRAEHQVFTNAWREAIPYGPNGTGMATRVQVEGAARQIYGEYPEILQALGLG